MGPISGAVAAYLVGCVPAARVASRLSAGRPVEPWAALAADVLKGFVAVWLFAPNPSIGQALVVTALVAGDQWPVAGREIGRGGHWALLGALAALTPVAPPLWLVFWGLGFVVTGYRADGRLVATALLPPTLGFVAGGPLGWIALPGCLMVLERGWHEARQARHGGEAKHHWNSTP